MGDNFTAVYLDSAATSFPKPEAVYQAVSNFMREVGVSAGRGAYRRALEADRVIFETRSDLAKLFNIKDVTRIVLQRSKKGRKTHLLRHGKACRSRRSDGIRS